MFTSSHTIANDEEVLLEESLFVVGEETVLLIIALSHQVENGRGGGLYSHCYFSLQYTIEVRPIFSVSLKFR